MKNLGNLSKIILVKITKRYRRCLSIEIHFTRLSSDLAHNAIPFQRSTFFANRLRGIRFDKLAGKRFADFVESGSCL